MTKAEIKLFFVTVERDITLVQQICVSYYVCYYVCDRCGLGLTCSLYVVWGSLAHTPLCGLGLTCSLTYL